VASIATHVASIATHTLRNKGSSGVFTNTSYNKPYPKGFLKTGFFSRFSQREKPYRVGFVMCVGEKPLKNPYF
jgi:hypothetical protein